jgi:hypothetical protein
LWVVGDNKSDYLSDLLENKNVKYFKSTYDIENFIHNSDETAGILLGRTTIEGWMCNKPGWIYNVDNMGNIISKELFNTPEDMDKFKSSNVSKIIKQTYINILNQ